MEPSEQAYQFVMNRGFISRLVAMGQGTLEPCGLTDKQYDLVIMSHVLEHVENPDWVLSGVMPLARYVLIEVPLEGYSCGNLRAAVKSTATGVPRHNNYAGPLQFFSTGEVRCLNYWCGREIVGLRHFAPLVSMRKMSACGSMPMRPNRKRIIGLVHIVGECLFARFYHGFYAVFIAPHKPMGKEDRTLWPPS